MKIVSLTVGDPSHDGHGKSKTHVFTSNRTAVDAEKAYDAGCLIAGFDLSENIARAYQDHRLPEDVAAKLRALGFPVDDQVDRYGGDDDHFVLWTDSFAAIWWFVAKLGDPEITFEACSLDINVNIGGYGVFGS